MGKQFLLKLLKGGLVRICLLMLSRAQNIGTDVECCAGDIAAAYADPSLAAEELNWRAELDLEKACEDAWRWQITNPNGYGELHKTGAISLNVSFVVTVSVAGSGAPPGSRRV